EVARPHRFLRGPLRLVIARAGAGAGAQRAHLREALDAGRAREREHVPRGLRVQALEGDPAPALLADDTDQMDEGGAALHARSEAVGLQDVTGNAVDGLEALEVVLGARPDEAADEKTLRKKCADDRLADEAGAAGHEHALRHEANRSTGSARRDFRAAPSASARIIRSCGFARPCSCCRWRSP